MIISRAGNGHCEYAAYCGCRYAAYSNAGGLIVARISDGFSTYFQPGDSADSLTDELDSACKVADCELDAIDSVLGEYDDGESFISPSDAGGAPSSDGMFFGFYRRDASA